MLLVSWPVQGCGYLFVTAAELTAEWITHPVDEDVDHGGHGSVGGGIQADVEGFIGISS